MPAPPPTRQAAWRQAAQRIDRFEARLLLERVCRCTHADLLAEPGYLLSLIEITDFAALVARRVADLTAYQNARYARDYEAFVTKVGAVGDERLTRAVATQLHRLMAYKDEYEVARLHSLPLWKDALAHGFTGTQRIEMHLAPPVMAKADPVTGVPAKRAFGPWMFKAMGLLRHGKVLRGSALDPFGRSEERRMERALPGEFRAGVERLLSNPALAAEWAEAWAGVKGFGHIKARNLAATRARLVAIEAPAVAAE